MTVKRDTIARSCVVIALFAAGGVGCARSDPAPSRSNTASGSASAVASAAASAASAEPKVQRPQHPAEAVLMAWNSALDRRDPERLAALYAARVRFYGVSKAADDVIKLKRAAFNRTPDYHQRIEKVQIAAARNGFVVRFDKYSGQALDAKVAARLTLESTEGRLLIVEETDSTTDKRLARSEPMKCSDAALSAVSGHSVVQSDIKRVARENPDVHPAGLLYSEDPLKVEAAWGYMHPDRFEPRWWIELAGARLTATNALTGEQLAFSAQELQRVEQACSASDAGRDH
jgi:hypothetical protein